MEARLKALQEQLAAAERAVKEAEEAGPCEACKRHEQQHQRLNQQLAAAEADASAAAARQQQELVWSCCRAATPFSYSSSPL